MAADVCTSGMPSHTHFTIIPMRKSILDLQSLQEHLLMLHDMQTPGKSRMNEWTVVKTHYLLASQYIKQLL